MIPAMIDCEEGVRATKAGLFEVARQGRTLILIPQTDLSELDYQEIEAGARHILRLLGNSTIRHVVLDFHKTDYYGSTALGFFVKLLKRVRELGGRMALCGLSDHGREILKVTNLDSLWPICASREEALKTVQS
jgi:anti-anti-sigma factor